MTDFRELCRELLQIEDEQPSDYADWMRRWKAAIFRARAALAQPEPEVVGPTDEELWEVWRGLVAPAGEGEVAELVVRLRRASDGASAMGWEQDSWVIARAADLLEQRHPTPVPVAEPEPEAGPTDEELDSMERQHWEETGVEEWGRQEAIFDHRAFARAVLARWGHQLAPLAEVGCPACEGVPKPGNQPCAVCGRPAPAPAEGEVAELVEFLRIYGDEVMDEYGDVGEHDQLTRAAELLEQRHPTPVPVAERLPGPKDCDAEGRCWVHQPHEACPESPAWELMLAKYASANYEAVCWLPANALPLPSGEVE